MEPHFQENAGATEVFLKAHFDYNPKQDRLIPSQVPLPPPFLFLSYSLPPCPLTPYHTALSPSSLSLLSHITSLSPPLSLPPSPQDAGLPFKKGDVLTVMNQEDSFWWQAVRYGERDLAKLIPSQMLEERYKNMQTLHVYTCLNLVNGNLSNSL